MFKKVSTILVITALLAGTIAIEHSDARSSKKRSSTKSSGATTSSKKNVTYKNCTEARAAGVTPIYQGEPGYSSKLDRDHDGIACE